LRPLPIQDGPVDRALDRAAAAIVDGGGAGGEAVVSAGVRECGNAGMRECERFSLQWKADELPSPRCEDGPMQNPKDLAISGRALELALAVYRLTEQFPSPERFGLTAPMRRAAVSVGSNIAEGCGRWGNREFLQFLQVSYSSATE